MTLQPPGGGTHGNLIGPQHESLTARLITSQRTFNQRITGVNCKCVIYGFHRDVDENCAFMGYYAASSVNSLPTLRDNLSVPSSRVQESKKWLVNVSTVHERGVLLWLKLLLCSRISKTEETSSQEGKKSSKFGGDFSGVSVLLK